MGQNSSLTDRTFKGLFWMFSGKGTQAILQFLVLIVLARLLSPSDFGVVNAATVVITFTTVFSKVGVGPALVQRPELNQSHVRTGFTMTIILSVFFAGVFYFGSPVIANFFNMTKLENVLEVMSVIFLLQGFSTVAQSLIQREMKFRIFVSIDVVSYIVYGVVGVSCAFFGMDYWSLVFAQISQNLLKAILLITVTRHNMRPQFHWESFKELFFFGSGFTIARISNQFALQADNLVIGRWLGADALGLYTRAYQLMVMPTNLFGQVLDRVLFPAMAHIQNKQDKLSYSFRIGITSIAFFAIPASVLMYFLAEDIVLLLLGSKWLNLVPAFQMLSLGILFRTEYKISDTLARATGAVYRRAWRQAFYAVGVFVGALIGQQWGIIGVSIGVLGAIILNYGLMTHLSLKYINLSIMDIIKAHAPGVFLGTLAALSILITKLVNTTISLPALINISFSGGVFLVFAGILVKFNATKFMGKDIIWIKNQVEGMVRGRKNGDS